MAPGCSVGAAVFDALPDAQPAPKSRATKKPFLRLIDVRKNQTRKLEGVETIEDRAEAPIEVSI